VVFLLFVGCGALLSNTSDNTGDNTTTTEQPAPAEEPAGDEPAQAEENVAGIGEPARDGKFEFVVTKVEPPLKTIGQSFAQEEAQGSSSSCGST
jgi:hypothetical protein